LVILADWKKVPDLKTGPRLCRFGCAEPQAGLQLIAEIGTDMSRWPTDRHFTSWLTPAPTGEVAVNPVS
jgi:hypothetical protein